MVPGWVHLRSKPSDFQLKIERICDHIDHICQLAGNAKQVGIGTDLDGGFGREQSPMDLDTIADLQLELLDADGVRTDTLELGGPTGASVSADGPDFSAGMIRLIGQADGLPVAWGQTAEFTHEQQQELSLLVSSAESIGWFQPTDGRYGSALTALGGGQFWLSGGQTLDTADPRAWPETTGDILLLSLADQALSFTGYAALPEYPDPACDAEPCATITARTGHSLIRLGGVDEGSLLLTGGASQWRSVAGYGNFGFDEEAGFITDDARIYDPETETWEQLTHEEDRNNPEMPYRAFHLAIPMQDGGVALWGGFSNDNFPSENIFIEVLSTGARAFTKLEAPEPIPGPLWAAGAPTENGAVICGGVSALGEYNLDANTVCMRVVSATTVETFDPLPKPRAGHAMITLPDKRILLTGGAELPFADELTLNGTYLRGEPASADIMVYTDGQGWQYYPDKLSGGRAGHRMAMLPDGRVLLYGGASHFSPTRCRSRPAARLNSAAPRSSIRPPSRRPRWTDARRGCSSPRWPPILRWEWWRFIAPACRPG